MAQRYDIIFYLQTIARKMFKCSSSNHRIVDTANKTSSATSAKSK